MKFELIKPIEAHQFDGSSTSVSELQHWHDTGVFVRHAVRTRDLRPQAIIDDDFGGYVLHRGDWLVNFFGDFLVMGDESLHQVFKEVQDA